MSRHSHQAFIRVLFEANDRPDGTTFEVRVPYESVPLDFRERIKMEWKVKTGKKPIQMEVSDQYARFLLRRKSKLPNESSSGEW